MKYFLTSIFILFNFFISSAQCNINIILDSWPSDSINICKGDTVDIAVVGSIRVIDSNFDNDQMGDGWENFTIPSFTNPCIPHPNGSTYIWFDNSTSAPRYIETENFKTVNGGTITFDLVFAIQFGANPCEGPDVDNEGVSLQYSNDSGNTWQDIIYFCPTGDPDWFLPTNPNTANNYFSGTTPFTSWATYSFPIPTGAQTPSTKFRWIQLYSTDKFDNWGLDNIMIDLNISDVYWSQGSTALVPPKIHPPITTNYKVSVLSHYTGEYDTVCTDEVKVKVYKPIHINIDSITICNGEEVTLYVINGCLEYLWSNGSTYNSITVKPTHDTVFSVILTDVYGCINKDTSHIYVKDSTDIKLNYDELCYGDTKLLQASGGVEYLWSTGDTTQYLLYTADSNKLFVTVTNEFGCINDKEIMINPLPIVKLSNDTIVCYKERIELNVSGGVNYLWSNGNTNDILVVRPYQDTTFNVIVYDVNNCVNYDTVNILVNTFKDFNVYVTNDTICRTKYTTIEAYGASEYLWNTGSNDSIISVSPIYTMPYTVIGSVIQYGLKCDITKMVEIIVEDCDLCFVPNAFTPEGLNPVFKPKFDFHEVTDYLFIIYDRWGRLIFQTRDFNTGWDGKIKGEYAPTGVYIYRIQYVNKIREEFQKNGVVTLIR